MTTSSLDDFPAVQLNAPDKTSARVFLHGGHVASWQTPEGHERLFLSQRARLGPGVALRGGVPVIFPQFAGLGPLLKHGFARITAWEHLGTGSESPGTVTGRFRLQDNRDTRSLWNHAFQLDLHVTVGGPSLHMTLEVTNPDTQSFEFTAALHTYLFVEEITNVTVQGLENLAYREHGIDAVQTASPLRIQGNIDRIYWRVSGPITVQNSDHTLQVTAQGFPDAVVWNPGPELGATLPDLGPEDYRHMLCVEAAVIGQAVKLAPGERWSGAQRITVL